MNTKSEYFDEMVSDLPYGMWKDTSGREIIFNRRYQPILQRDSQMNPSIPDRAEWVEWIEQSWFRDDEKFDPREKGVVGFQNIVRCNIIRHLFVNGLKLDRYIINRTNI